MALAFCSSTALTVGALFHALLALRFLLAAFGAATVPLAQSFVATFTEERRRVSGMGLMSVAISSGTVIGSALLWAAATTGIAASLLVIAAMGAGALIVVYGFLPYSIPRTVPTSTKRAAQIVTVLPYLGITFVGFVAYSMVVPLIGLRLIDRFGLNSDAALGMSGLALTCASLTLLLAHVGVAARPGWRAPSLLRVGSLGALGGLTMLVVATNVVLLVAAMATVGLSLGLVGPANLGAMSLASGKDVQGKVGGLNAAARGLGISVGPITGTALYEVNQDLPLIAAMALICVAFGLSFLRPDATAHA